MSDFRITGVVNDEQLAAILAVGAPLTVEAINLQNRAQSEQSSTPVSSDPEPALAAATAALKKIRHGRNGNPGCTPKNWAIIHGAAEHFAPDESFTLGDLAGKTGETYEAVFARFRTLAKPQNALKIEIFHPVPGTSKPKRYTLDAVMHRAIMAA